MFAPILDVLIRQGDYYLHLADLKSYSEAHTRLGEAYEDQEAVVAEGGPQHRGVQDNSRATGPSGSTPGTSGTSNHAR